MRCHFFHEKINGALPVLAVLLSLSSGCECCYTAELEVPQSFHSSSTAGLPAALADGLHVYLGVRLLFVGHVID